MQYDMKNGPAESTAGPIEETGAFHSNRGNSYSVNTAEASVPPTDGRIYDPGMPAWFNELDASFNYLKHALMYRGADPWKMVRELAFLGPEELREGFTHPKLPGMAAAPEEIPVLIRQAAWYRENCTEAYPEQFKAAGFFVVRHYGNKPIVARFGKDGHLAGQSFADFHNSYKDKFLLREVNKKNGLMLERQPFTPWWVQDERTPRWDSVEFRPGVPQTEMPDEVLNLWRGWPVAEITPLRDEWNTHEEPRECSMFLENMRKHLCGDNEEYYRYLLGWCADALQNPSQPGEVAIVLRGPMGQGKGTFGELFAEMFAPHALILNQSEQLLGTFNKHLHATSMVFADEAFFANNKKDANTLKTLVTSPQILIQPKFVDAFMAPRLFRIIMASNERHVVDAAKDDRRFFVLNVDTGKSAAEMKPWFAQLRDQWKHGGRTAFFRWLRSPYWRERLEREWTGTTRPVTEALEAQKDQSLRGADLVVYNILDSGELPAKHPFKEECGRLFVATSVLAEAVRLDPRELTELGVLLGKVSGGGRTTRVSLDGYGQPRGVWLPPLAEARERWEAMVGRKVAWNPDVADWDDPGRDEPF